MNYNKKTVRDVDVAGKKVLLRCDFNVPQDKETGAITSDKRIVAALPTIRYLLENGAAVIACSHLGKPVATFESYVKKQVEKGKDADSIKKEDWKKSLKKLSLAPVAQRLSELLGQDVIFAHDVVGEDAKAKAAEMQAKAEKAALEKEAEEFDEANAKKCNKDVLKAQYIANKDVAKALVAGIPDAPAAPQRVLNKQTASTPSAREEVVLQRNKAVAEYRTAHKCDFNTAWTACRSQNPELFAD